MAWSARRRMPLLPIVALALMLALTLTTAVARAESGLERERAAAAYDAAVVAFDSHDYASAAKHFLEADALAPSNDALLNALTAAERANDPVLAVTVAERVLEPNERPVLLVTRARRVLGEARNRVAWLTLECSGPCEIELDGSRREPGRAVVKAGSHLIVARAPGGVAIERRIEAQGGSEQRVTLAVTAVRPSATSTAPPRATSAAPDERQPGPTRDRSTPRIAFYAGTALTAGLAGVTVWSGIDAMNGRNSLPGTPEETQAVVDSGHRTDALLAGTLLAAALTATVGLLWVEWDAP